MPTTSQPIPAAAKPRILLILTFAIIGLLYILYLASTVAMTIRLQTSPPPQVYSATHGLPQNDFSMFWYSGILLIIHAAGQYGWRLTPSPWMLNTFQIPFTTPTPQFHLSWMYPPPMGLLSVLYAALPLGISYWVFRVIFLAAAAALYRRAHLAWPAIIIGLAGPAELHDMFGGQNGALTGALAVSSLLLIDKSPRTAGIFAGLLSIKPQIGLMLPLILFRKHRLAAVAAAIACAICLALLTLPLEGINSWTWFFLNAWRAPAHFVARPLTTQFPSSGITVFFMARTLHATTRIAWTCQAACSLTAAGLIYRLWRHPAPDNLARTAITLCLWILLTPYGYMYDLAGFSVVMAAMFINAPDRQKPLYATLWLAAGYTGTLANLTGIIWMPPIAATGAAAIALVSYRPLWGMIFSQARPGGLCPPGPPTKG